MAERLSPEDSGTLALESSPLGLSADGDAITELPERVERSLVEATEGVTA